MGFANSRGGHVFFGITDKRVIKGQDVADDTIEKLISNLDMHIYPSLPLEHEEIPLTNGKTVIRVWPGDRPPIVGGYVFSTPNLKLDDRVELAKTQAYRRVGRQTRKVDLMWLRGTLVSDPLIVIDVQGRAEVQNDLPRFPIKLTRNISDPSSHSWGHHLWPLQVQLRASVVESQPHAFQWHHHPFSHSRRRSGWTLLCFHNSPCRGPTVLGSFA